MFTNRQKRALNRMVARTLHYRCDELARRAALRTLLAERADPQGNAYVEVWSRDCDLAEGTSLHLIPARVPAFVDLERHTLDSAEGPTYFEVLTPTEGRAWHPTFRDRAAEMAGY